MSLSSEFVQILKKSGWLALLALIVGSFNDQLLARQLELSLMSEFGLSWQVFVIAFFSLINGLIFPLLALMALLWGISSARGRRIGLPEFLSSSANQVYIETVRSWGSSLAWGLLLILPGLFRLIQLIFIPFVVIFLKDYQTGQIDALKKSTRYFMKRPWRMMGYVFLFMVLLPLILTAQLDPWRSYLSQPLAAFLCTLIDLVLLVISAQVLFRLFDRIRQEHGDESLLSMAGHSQPQ